MMFVTIFVGAVLRNERAAQHVLSSSTGDKGPVNPMATREAEALLRMLHGVAREKKVIAGRASHSALIT